MYTNVTYFFHCKFKKKKKESTQSVIVTKPNNFFSKLKLQIWKKVNSTCFLCFLCTQTRRYIGTEYINTVQHTFFQTWDIHTPCCNFPPKNQADILWKKRRLWITKVAHFLSFWCRKNIPLLFRTPKIVNDLSVVNKLYIDPNWECEWFYL